MTREDSSDPAALTSRDIRVLTLLTWGRTNQEIAQELGVSLTTVKSYIRLAYSKVGVTRRTQAVVWGFRNGLFPYESASTARRLRSV